MIPEIGPSGLSIGVGWRSWFLGCFVSWDGVLWGLRRRDSGGDAKRNQTKADSLQANNQTISEFIHRTDKLAVRMGMNLSDIPDAIGISKAMLYAYRNGKNRITQKVWAKLEAAEQAYGPPPTKEPEPAGETAPEPPEQRTETELIDLLERIATALEKLVEKLP